MNKLNNQNNAKKKFIQFLKEHDAVTKYCAGLANPKWDDIQSLIDRKGMSLSEMLNGMIPEDWIQFAFSWSNSTKGFDYWYNLNEKWNELI